MHEKQVRRKERQGQADQCKRAESKLPKDFGNISELFPFAKSLMNID